LRIKFQAEADFDARVISSLKRIAPEIDFRSATDAALHRVKAPDVLRLAAESGRVLVSHDRNTMPAHFREFVATAQSPGILIVRQSAPISAIVQDLLLIWHTCDPEEFTNRILFGSHSKPNPYSSAFTKGVSSFRTHNALVASTSRSDRFARDLFRQCSGGNSLKLGSRKSCSSAVPAPRSYGL